MKKIIKRIRITQDTDNFMTQNCICKQKFIEKAIIEKLTKDFNYKIKTPF